MSHSFARALATHGQTLAHTRTRVLQVNVGKLCNLTCGHCHVNAGPRRKEIITRETVDRILDWLEKTDIPVVDLTGGAPEMIPDFQHFIRRVKSMRPERHIIDRCNLTILLEPGYEGMAEFLAAHHVEIVASMPCYEPANVNAQRGDGVFDASIAALQLLNRLGYGADPRLPLNLVYNPLGPNLPPPQAELEADYKEALGQHFGIIFNSLYTITNMPIARFKSHLKNTGELENYAALLHRAYNPATVDALMCRDTLNISWQGEVFDCDFNQMLNLHWRDPAGRPLHLWDLNPATVENRSIATGDHCFGCTAGAGSSCGGAIS